MSSVTPEKVRSLTPQELGLESTTSESEATASGTELPPLKADDPVLAQVRAALEMNFAGVILCGPPGTGKTWYAKRLAEFLAEDPDAIRTVQFHPSYQYEDFMEGYVPAANGGFEIERKVFAELCDEAEEQPDMKHVIVIEEISRCDVARVFGEALTYIEVDKRGLPVTLASGNSLTVPPNIVILATMNPWDRGVDELDVALERRFAQIDMPPSVAALRTILEGKGAEPAFIEKVVEFFQGVQRLEDELCHLGHAYFRDCVDEVSARQVWDFRLHPFFKRACRLDMATLSSIRRMWLKVVPPADGNGAEESPPAEPEAGSGEP